MSRKGITPIIAIIILLLITVALAGTAWVFLQGVITSHIEKTFLVPTGGDFCIDSVIYVHIVNTGYTTDMIANGPNADPPGDIVHAEIDGGKIPIFSGSTINGMTGNEIPTGESKLAIKYKCEKGSICKNYGTTENPDYKGYHRIDIGTDTTFKHLNVFCR